MTRRDFIKTIGIAGIASSGLDIGKAEARVRNRHSCWKSRSIPGASWEDRRLSVRVLGLGGMFDTINNQLMLRQARNWGVTFWDTAEGYGNGSSEEGFGRFFTRNPESQEGYIPDYKDTQRRLRRP